MGLLEKTIKNVGYMYGASIMGEVLNFLTKIFVARLILPSDFGLFAIAFSIISALELIKGLGLSQAIIYSKKDLNKSASIAVYIELLAGILMFSLTFFSAPFISEFFNSPELLALIRFVSVIFIITGMGNIQGQVIVKKLEFKKYSIACIIKSIVYTVSAVGLALWGFGIWSLAIGHLLSSTVLVFIFILLKPFKLTLSFNWKLAKDLLKYGFPLLIVTFLSVLIMNLDRLAIGKILSESEVGFYAIAFSIVTALTIKLITPVANLFFPTVSSINADIEKLRKAYFMTTKFFYLLLIPAASGLFITAPWIINLLLGKTWNPAVVSVRILCFYGVISSIGYIRGGVFKSVGKPKIITKLTILRFVIIAIFIYPVTRYFGFNGTAVLITIASLISYIISSKIVCSILQTNLTQLAKFVFRSIISAAGMVLIVETLILFLERTIFNLALICLIGACIYCCLRFLLEPSLIKEIKSIIADLIK